MTEEIEPESTEPESTEPKKGKGGKRKVTQIVVDLPPYRCEGDPIFSMREAPVPKPGRILVVRPPYRTHVPNVKITAHAGLVVRLGPWVVFFRRLYPLHICGRPPTEQEAHEKRGHYVDDRAFAGTILRGLSSIFPAPPLINEDKDEDVAATPFAFSDDDTTEATQAATLRRLLVETAFQIGVQGAVSDAGLAAAGLPMGIIGPLLAERRTQAVGALVSGDTDDGDLSPDTTPFIVY